MARDPKQTTHGQSTVNKLNALLPADPNYIELLIEKTLDLTQAEKQGIWAKPPGGSQSSIGANQNDSQSSQADTEDTQQSNTGFNLNT